MIIEGSDSYTSASFPIGHRIRRQLWNLVWLFLFRPSPRPLHAWRSMILRAFGARIGNGSHVYPAAKIWAPWNLEIGDHVGIADGVIIYNMDKIKIGSYSVVSQGSHLCCGSHDYNSHNFQLFAKPITIGRHVWICAESFLSPGVVIDDGVVIGARSLVIKDIQEPWTVHAGHPAKKVGERHRSER